MYSVRSIGFRAHRPENNFFSFLFFLIKTYCIFGLLVLQWKERERGNESERRVQAGRITVQTLWEYINNVKIGDIKRRGHKILRVMDTHTMSMCTQDDFVNGKWSESFCIRVAWSERTYTYTRHMKQAYWLITPCLFFFFFFFLLLMFMFMCVHVRWCSFKGKRTNCLLVCIRNRDGLKVEYTLTNFTVIILSQFKCVVDFYFYTLASFQLLPPFLLLLVYISLSFIHRTYDSRLLSSILFAVLCTTEHIVLALWNLCCCCCCIDEYIFTVRLCKHNIHSSSC